MVSRGGPAHGLSPRGVGRPGRPATRQRGALSATSCSSDAALLGAGAGDTRRTLARRSLERAIARAPALGAQTPPIRRKRKREATATLKGSGVPDYLQGSSYFRPL